MEDEDAAMEAAMKAAAPMEDEDAAMDAALKATAAMEDEDGIVNLVDDDLHLSPVTRTATATITKQA